MRECDGRASGGHTRSHVTYPTADVYIQSQHRLSPRNLNGDGAAGSKADWLFYEKDAHNGKRQYTFLEAFQIRHYCQT